MLRTKVTVEQFNQLGHKELHLCDFHHDDAEVVYPEDRPAQAYLLDLWGYPSPEERIELDEGFDAIDNEESDVGQDDNKSWYIQGDIQNLPCGLYETRYVSDITNISCIMITKDSEGVKRVHSSKWSSTKLLKLSRLEEKGLEFKTIRMF